MRSFCARLCVIVSCLAVLGAGMHSPVTATPATVTKFDNTTVKNTLVTSKPTASPDDYDDGSKEINETTTRGQLFTVTTAPVRLFDLKSYHSKLDMANETANNTVIIKSNQNATQLSDKNITSAISVETVTKIPLSAKNTTVVNSVDAPVIKNVTDAQQKNVTKTGPVEKNTTAVPVHTSAAPVQKNTTTVSVNAGATVENFTTPDSRIKENYTVLSEPPKRQIANTLHPMLLDDNMIAACMIYQNAMIDSTGEQKKFNRPLLTADSENATIVEPITTTSEKTTTTTEEPSPYEKIAIVENTEIVEILAGLDAKRKQFPWHVALTFWSDRNEYGNMDRGVRCGGAVVGQRTIVTSAHCLYNSTTKEMHAIVELRMGVLFDQPEFSATVSLDDSYNYNVYPEFSPTDKYLRDDLALLYFEPYGYNLKPIKINADVNSYYTDRKYFTSFYGRSISPMSKQNNQLRYLLLRLDPVISRCVSYFGPLACHNIISTVGWYTPVDTICRGESGDPLVHFALKTPRLTALATFVCAKGCLINRPDGYLHLAPYVPWISANIKDE